jgi:hypothetical protein
MNTIPKHNTKTPEVIPNLTDTTNQTRREKTNSILTEVLPLAINLGLTLSKSDDGITDSKPIRNKTRDTTPTGRRTSGKAEPDGIANSAQAAGAAGALGELAGMSAVSSWAGMAGGLLGAIDIAANWGRSTPARGAASGSAFGAMVGTMFCPGVGTAIGAALGAVGGGLLGSIKTGKHKDQKVRDQVRELLLNKGVIDSNYSIGLANGSRFNIGYDGGPKKELGGRRPYEMELSNPLTKYAISWLSPVIALLSQGNQKVQDDFVGYFGNAALSNAKSTDELAANVNAIIKQFGLDDKTIAEAIIQAAKQGTVDSDTAKGWLTGIKERSQATTQ